MKTALSPKELGAAIGVSESSLKRWADSGRLNVARTAGGHRRIHLAEAIRFIRESGFSVNRPDILGLEDVELIERAGVRDDPAEEFHQALLKGQSEWARGFVLAQFLEGNSLARIVDQTIAPAMRRIGELWQHDADGIFVEHRAAEICNQALNRVRSLVATDDVRPVAIGGAPADDPYTLPSLMASAVLAAEGWSDVNLGAHTPTRVLARAARDCGASMVWFALSLERPGTRNADIVRALLRELESAGCRAVVAVGGPAVTARPMPAMEGAYHAGSMTALSAFARGTRSAAAAETGPPS